jgi:hypothetical protein
MGPMSCAYHAGDLLDVLERWSSIMIRFTDSSQVRAHNSHWLWAAVWGPNVIDFMHKLLYHIYIRFASTSSPD